MDPIEHLEERKWETPDSYGGFSPVGDYVIASLDAKGSQGKEPNKAREPRR